MAASVRPQTNFILIELEEGISEKQNAIFPYFTNYFVISFDNQMACWKTRISGNQRNTSCIDFTSTEILSQNLSRDMNSKPTSLRPSYWKKNPLHGIWYPHIASPHT